jgi:hexosaminidase
MSSWKRSLVAVLFASVVTLLTPAVFAADTVARPMQSNLLPVPRSVAYQSGRLAIDQTFSVALTAESDPRVAAAMNRAIRRLQDRTGLEFARGFANDATTAKLVISYESPSPAIPQLGEDESYEITVTAQQAMLKAKTSVGVLRGVETVLQLVSADRDGYFLPAVTISDSPRFPWRGLMVDVSRHFEPVENIKRTIDGMAAVKMNVLHWHLSDDQGFRVESKKYPKLQELGSGDGNYYTQEQIRDVVEYARERGVRVVPEFDIPGHSTSWLAAYPELGSAPGPYSVVFINRHAHYGVLDPTRKEVYKFLDNFVGEMSQLFPDAYFHIGGDEVNPRHWNNNEKIQKFMKSKGIATPEALQTYFNERLLKILQKHGKKMIGWDEILQPNLPKDIVVQSWRGEQSLSAGAKQGYMGILSAPYYLDHLSPAYVHYLADPLPEATTLTPEEQQRILGGEACMWAEYVSPQTIDSRIWPRAAAVAERLWSPRDVRDVPDMYRRLAIVSVQLEELGLTHESNSGRMLRRLAGTPEIEPLRTVIDAVEPFGFGERISVQHVAQAMPLTRFVDAATADCPVCIELPARIKQFLSDAPAFNAGNEDMKRTFTTWRDLTPRVNVLVEKSPVLLEVEPRIQQLSQLGQAGLEAMSYIQSGIAPPSGWKEAKLALIDQASKPVAMVRLPWLPAFRQLVIGAAEVDQLKTLTAQQWTEHVLSLAQPVAAGK